MLRSDSRVSGRKPDSRSLEAQEAALPEAAPADAPREQGGAPAAQRNVSGAATPEAARARRTTSSDLASLNVELPEQWYEPSDAWLPPLPPVLHAPASRNAPSARAPGRDAQPAARAGLHTQPAAAHAAESHSPQPETERGWRSHDWQRAHSPEQSWRTQEWQAQSYTSRSAPGSTHQRARPAPAEALAPRSHAPQRSAEPQRSSQAPSSHAASAAPERSVGQRGRDASRVASSHASSASPERSPGQRDRIASRGPSSHASGASAERSVGQQGQGASLGPSSHASSALPERSVEQPARNASSPLVATASSARAGTAQSAGPSSPASSALPECGVGPRGRNASSPLVATASSARPMTAQSGLPSSRAATASPERSVAQAAREVSSPLVATARAVTVQARGAGARAVEWQQPSAGSRGPASSSLSEAADFYAAPSESNWAQELASEVAEIEYEPEPPEATHAPASRQSWPSHTADSQVTGRYAGLSEQQAQSRAVASYAQTQSRDYASEVAAIGYEPQHGELGQETLQLDELNEADAHYEHTPVGSWRRNASGVLEPRPTTMRPRRRRSWTAPITAAVVVLAIVLGYSAARIQSWREKHAPQLAAAPAQVDPAPPASELPNASLETTRELAVDPALAPAPHNPRAAAESSTRAHNPRARRAASALETEQATVAASQPPAADPLGPPAVATTASSQTAAASLPALSPRAAGAIMASSETAASLPALSPRAAVARMASNENAAASLPALSPRAAGATVASSETAAASIQSPAPRAANTEAPAAAMGREARAPSTPAPSSASSSSEALDRALQPSAAPTGDAALALVDEVTRTAEARPPAPAPTASAQSAGPQPVLTIRPLDPAAEASAVQPTREQVRDAMLAMQPQLALCAGNKHGTSHANVTIQGNGRVSYSLIDGAFAGTEAGSCMARALRGAIFPTFSGPPFKVRYPLVF